MNIAVDWFVYLGTLYNIFLSYRDIIRGIYIYAYDIKGNYN